MSLEIVLTATLPSGERRKCLNHTDFHPQPSVMVQHDKKRFLNTDLKLYSCMFNNLVRIFCAPEDAYTEARRVNYNSLTKILTPLIVLYHEGDGSK